ncbi:4-hydroxy-tetrahydrodipicolinate synthase [Silvibacterium bohemicum]|uniref:4-hydroxy-tetrahydrodipicolinate synthase n=1 Tax=Silvibacterium bohemicum TaxID=1577686 RepID=A0A841JR89_9BACT|nr:dihydrodipicolinate synthase family protein [Silvibacterium bohemicum]MBB6143923.1 4-hydroxy-tetrahydrodipicolinate synthase [Silvibacterium bohemicum]
MNWFGVMPAMTTAFDEKLGVDHTFMRHHAEWMVANGCSGLVMLGSLGEAATLTSGEKVSILKNIVATAGKTVPIVSAISALSTADAISLAKSAADAGCSGLMVLPPYVYRGDWREMKAHIAAIFKATPLSCMLYNNPVAYGTDFVPEQIVELAGEHENFAAVKESSTDVRRVSAIRALLGDRLKIFVGVDDAIVEGIAMGATGWVAGLVNAFPAESVALFNLALEGKSKEAFDLYKWFLPLLRMDTVPKFIQLIKYVQEQVGVGSARVRPPRLEITGDELAETKRIVLQALESRPTIHEVAFAHAAR